MNHDNWHCLNLDSCSNCTVDCSNEPCIMVPHSPFDIERLKLHRAYLLKGLATVEQQIANHEQENAEALTGRNALKR